MTDQTPSPSRRWQKDALLPYLVVQGTLLLLSYLDYPIIKELYRQQGYVPVTGWLGLWLAGLVFGLSTGLLLLVGPTWKLIFDLPERVRLAGGYLAGVAAALVAFGLRFAHLLPGSYYFIVAALILAAAAVFGLWARRDARSREIFP